MLNADAERAKIVKEFNDGKVTFDLFPGGIFGTIGVVVAILSSLISLSIVLFNVR